jgi:hypothetical protein
MNDISDKSKVNSKKNSKKRSKNTNKKESKISSKKNSKVKSKINSKTNKKLQSKIKNSHTMRNIKKNIISIKKKLEDKKMTNVFWVLAERSDFKPLTKTVIKNNEEIKNIIHSMKEIRDNLLDEKGEYYKNKKLASIKISFHEDVINKLEKSNYNGFLNDSILLHKDYLFIKEKPIISISITIFPIDEEGTMNPENLWGIKVNYFIDDFTGIKFKIKNVEVLMRLVSDSVIKSDLNEGMSYKNLSLQLNKKNKKYN